MVEGPRFWNPDNAGIHGFKTDTNHLLTLLGSFLRHLEWKETQPALVTGRFQDASCQICEGLCGLFEVGPRVVFRGKECWLKGGLWASN